MTDSVEPVSAAMGAVAELKDIHMPGSPGWWPPAPGWWLLFVILLLLAYWLGKKFYHLWQRRRVEQEVLKRLDSLQRPTDEQHIPQLLSEISVLLRRVALMKYSREQVAELTGKEWTAFLDQHGGDGQYTSGAGSVLAHGPYVRYESVGEVDVDRLLLLARQWIKHNIGRV